MSKWINLLGLSFFSAVLGETVFFTIIDPQQLYLFGEPVSWEPIAVYSVGFFMFWSLTFFNAALVTWLQKPADEVNREPAEHARRLAQRNHLKSI
jgi:hypothetical protein